jgi:hypothetical protein
MIRGTKKTMIRYDYQIYLLLLKGYVKLRDKKTGNLLNPPPPTPIFPS